MIRGNIFSSGAIFPISAAMLCSSPSVFAQDTAAEPTIVTPTIAPQEVVATPPVVSTIPDVVAAKPVVEEDKPVISAKAARPTPPRAKAAPKPSTITLPTADTETDSKVDSGVSSPPLVEDVSPIVATVEDTATVAPLEQSQQSQISDETQDDWIIYGGLAAALGLAGLGAAFNRRRRRSSEPVSVAPTKLVPATVADVQPAQPLTAPRPAPRVIQPSFANRHLPPVTDPLFAHQPVFEPITDPLFAHQMVVPPVTDPMFADRAEYVGRAAAFDTRRTWPAVQSDERPENRELEPVE